MFFYRWALVFLLVMPLMFGTSCQKGDEDVVVLYCSVDQAVAEPIVAEFERATGIKVKARYDVEALKTVALVNRIKAEAKRPVADVFWSSEVFYTIGLAEGGFLESYQSEATANWPNGFADASGRWYGFGLRGRVIAFNSERVSEEEAPKSLEDLLDSRWKGRLVMATPTFGTTGGDVSSWFVHYGEARAKEILQGLKDNQVQLVGGNSTAVQWLAAGRADVCLTDTDDVYAGRRNGWAIKRNFLDQGGAGVLAIPNTAALIKGRPNPKKAYQLMSFILSEQVERMLAESDSHNAPIHESLAEEFEAYLIPNPLAVDYAEVAALLQESLKTALEILE